MNNLQKHYDEKWNKLSKVSELIDGGLWSYSVTLTHQKYEKCYLLIRVSSFMFLFLLQF